MTSSLSSDVERPAPPTGAAPVPGAVRSGALLFAATLAGVAATYLFYLVSGRLLGPDDYGTLAAVLSLLTIVSLPFSALQMALSRDVSSHVTRAGDAEAALLTRALLRWAGIATVGLLAVFLALSVPLESLLQLDSIKPLLFAVVSLAPVVLAPVLLGDIQGRQQFSRLAIATSFPLVFRCALFLVLAVAGWRLYGALFAIAVGSLAGLALPVWWRRDLLRRVPRPRVSVRPFLVALVPVMVGLLAVTALTNVDVLIVKARLPGEDAGIYGAASAFAKVAFFLPMAIVGVIFPRVAARRARGEETGDILGRTLIVTAGFCAVLFTFYGLLGTPLVRLTYGAEFEEAGSLLGLFGIGMTFFSLANVLVSYHLSRHEPRFAWIVAGAAVCQAVALAVVPAGLETFLWVNAGVGIALVAAHELVMGSSAGAIRAGAVHAWAELRPQLRVRAWLRAARRPLLEAGIALAGFTALTVAITWPLVTDLGSVSIGGGGDVSGTIAGFWQQAEYTGYHVTGVSDITFTGAPYGWEQGNGVNIQSSLAYFPAYLLTEAFGPVVAYNLVVLAGLVLSGAAMYWLVRRLTGSILIAAWSGLVFVIFPWHIAKAETHGSLAHLEGFPLLALALLAWYRRPGALSLAYLAGAMAVLWTTSGYYGVIALVALAALLPITAWYQRSRLGPGRAAGRLLLAGAAVLAVSLAVYGIASLGKARGAIAEERQVADLAWFGARIWEFFVPAADSTVFGDLTFPWLASRQHLSNLSETTLYVGWLTLALALVYVGASLVRWRRLTPERRFLTSAFSSMVVVAILFMPPYPISLGGVNIPTPPWLLWKAIPQFRVPTRFMPLLMLGLICLAALALVLVRRRLEARARTGRGRRAVAVGLVAAVGAFSFVELASAPPPYLVELGVPPEYIALEQAPPGILVEYPLAATGEARTSDYIFWQRYHRRPLLNGAPAGTFPDVVRQVLIDPSAPGVAGALATLGVAAVITRNDVYQFPGGKFTTPDELGEGYRLLGSAFGGGTKIWQVTAEPEPFAVFPYGFWFSERYPGRLPAQWMSAQEGIVEIIAPEAGRYAVHFQAESFEVPRRLVIHGQDSSWAVEVENTESAEDFFVPVEVPKGRSTFRVTIEPGPTQAPPPDPRQVGVFMSNWLFEPLGGRFAGAEPVRSHPTNPHVVPPAGVVE